MNGIVHWPRLVAFLVMIGLAIGLFKVNLYFVRLWDWYFVIPVLGGALLIAHLIDRRRAATEQAEDQSRHIE